MPLRVASQLKHYDVSNVASFSAHAHRKYRSGALSVTPRSVSPEALPDTKKSKGKIIRAESRSSKEPNKTRPRSCTLTDTSCFQSKPVHQTRNIPDASKKGLSTIPEYDETTEFENIPNPPETKHHLSRDTCLGQKNNLNDVNHAVNILGKNVTSLYCNQRLRHLQKQLDERPQRPGCAVAAWVGQRCTSDHFQDALPMDTAQFLIQNQRFCEQLAERSHRVQMAAGNIAKPPGTGKLLYKRGKTAKNTLETVAQSFKSLPHVMLRQPAYSPPPRGRKEPAKSPLESQRHTPTVFRLTHKIN